MIGRVRPGVIHIASHADKGFPSPLHCFNPAVPATDTAFVGSLCALPSAYPVFQGSLLDLQELPAVAMRISLWHKHIALHSSQASGGEPHPPEIARVFHHGRDAAQSSAGFLQLIHILALMRLSSISRTYAPARRLLPVQWMDGGRREGRDHRSQPPPPQANRRGCRWLGFPIGQPGGCNQLITAQQLYMVATSDLYETSGCVAHIYIYIYIYICEMGCLSRPIPQTERMCHGHISHKSDENKRTTRLRFPHTSSQRRPLLRR